MSESHFWRDGGTRHVYLAGIPGLHPELRLTVRTTTNTQIDDLNEECRGLMGGHEAIRKRQMQFVADQIVAWQIPDAPVTADSVLHLQRLLHGRVVNVVYGTDPGDPDPKKEADPPATPADLEKN